MKSATVTAIVLFALPAAAFAQQSRTEERTDRLLYSDRAGYTELNFGLRASMPLGDLFEGQEWEDFYTAGLGLEIQYTELWKSSRGIYGGWYGGISLESFGGRRNTFTDPVLGTMQVKSDRLNLASAELGIRFREDFKTFRFDQNIGIGATFYSGADIEDAAIPGSDGEFIDATITYMFTVGLRVGAPIGDGCELGLGVAYRINGTPKEGEDAKGLVNFRPLQEVIIALTLDFVF
jgi:hypothetical protein